MSRTRAALIGAVGAFALATPAGAQLVSTIDLGAASLRYENDFTASAISLSPAAQYERGRALLLAAGSLSRFESGALSSSGFLFGSMLARPLTVLRRLVHGEMRLTAAGSAHEDNTRAAQYLAQLRAHVPLGAGGLWIGGAAGQAWNGDSWRSLSLAEGGAWWRGGAALLSTTVSPARAGDTTWTDFTGSARWTLGAVEAGGSVGFRAGGPEADRDVWAAAHGTYWITPRVALNATIGTYLADHAMGTPGGRYIGVGIRLATRTPVLDALHRRDAEPPPALVRPVAGRLTVRDEGSGQRTIRIEVSGARRVELMGDFTEWRVVELSPERAGGTWTLTLPLPAGSHRFNVRVNGGDWGIPSGVMAITDDFDGVVGILVIK